MTDREKLIEILTQHCRKVEKEFESPPCDKEYCDENKEECNGELADHLIANGVTVQKRGEWKFDEGEMEHFCSECGHNAPIGMSSYILHKYCPNCGADMRKEKTHDTCN